MSLRESYYINQTGPNPENIKKALRWLVSNSEESNFIAIEYIRNLREIFIPIMGKSNVENLIKNVSITIDDIKLSLITKRVGIFPTFRSTLVAFYPSEKFLDELDSIYNINIILVVPYIITDIEKWIKTWSAVELGKKFVDDRPIFIKNKVVINALQTLTLMVKKEKILSDYNKEKCAWAFIILQDAGEFYNPEDIKSHLIRYEGWKAIAAEEAAEIAQKILDGKKIKKGDRPWVENILEIWRENRK